MNIQGYRSSFYVSIVCSDLYVTKSISDILELSGYSVFHYLNEDNFEKDASLNPPHILILSYEHTRKLKDKKAEDWVDSLLARWPNLKVVVLSEKNKIEGLTELFEVGLYDILEWPCINSRQLLKSIDRAAESDYFTHHYEKLTQQIENSASPMSSSSYSLLYVWLQELYKKKDSASALQHLMSEVSRYLAGSEVLFFKYNPQRAALVAQNSVGLELRLLQNIGIDLRSSESNFNETFLLKPQSLNGLKDLIVNGFRKNNYGAYPILAGREIRGVLVALPNDSTFDVATDAYIRICLEAYFQFERILSLKTRLQKTSLIDDQTEVFNRDFILKKVREEISRARRILKPVAALLLSVDRFQEFQLSQPQVEVDKLLKSIGQLFVRNSRLNDLVGRLEVDQFILVLPHTDKKGAAVKAERLRRMIEAADFSKILNQASNFTVSIGVSEYPSICHDADSLIGTAEEALYEIKKKTNNKVCLATPKGQFVADFEVEEES